VLESLVSFVGGRELLIEEERGKKEKGNGGVLGLLSRGKQKLKTVLVACDLKGKRSLYSMG